MTRATVQLAPSWLPRQQRRYVDRQLRQLMRRDVCSVCGKPFQHNSHTTSGLDKHGTVTVAGECCSDRIAVVFGLGLFSHRKYDFLQPRERKDGSEPTNKQIVDAIATYQEVIADTDKRLDGIERRGGVTHPLKVNLLDSPWKKDDCDWFKRNPSRSHRMRVPFPGELEGVKIPAGRKAIMFARQVKPGRRLRAALDPDVVLLPGSPNDEACAHALFEVAIGHEAMPPDAVALDALIKKYTASKEPGQ
jgi:hypothetical protein